MTNRFRKMPVEITATQWHRNGDHPDDAVGIEALDGLGQPFIRQEGAVVRFYRHPDVPGYLAHRDVENTARPQCAALMHDHGWIDTMEGGHTVCPGDWIITGVRGEVYPCEQQIFEETYEPVDGESKLTTACNRVAYLERGIRAVASSTDGVYVLRGRLSNLVDPA